MGILSAAEAGALGGVTLLDLSLCDGGCSGSPLLCADPLPGAAAWQRAPHSAPATSDAAAVREQRPYAQRPGVRLDADMAEAIRKLCADRRAGAGPPGRDCGACGAPTCAAFAEDVVMGRAEAAALSACRARGQEDTR